MEMTDSDESQDSPRQGLKMMEAVDVASGDHIVEMPAFSPVNTGRQRCTSSSQNADKVRILPTVITWKQLKRKKLIRLTKEGFTLTIIRYTN